MSTHLTLPWPISVNAMYRAYGYRIIKTKEATAWTKAAVQRIRSQAGNVRYSGPVEVSVLAYEPALDRRRDLDNLSKIVQDSITKAKLWDDDSLVRKTTWEFMPTYAPHPRGILIIYIQNYRNQHQQEGVPL